MGREVRRDPRDLTEAAERHAVDVFARNLRSLLLQPPIPKQVVLAIDPGLKSGCKVAVLDDHGNLLEHGVIHPHAPQNRRHEAKVFLKDLVGKHKVGVVAIGNGTACRETEELVAEIIAEGTHFHTNPGATSMTPDPAASAIAEPSPAPTAESAPTVAEPTTVPAEPAEVSSYPEPAASPLAEPFAARAEESSAPTQHFAAPESSVAEESKPEAAPAEGEAHHAPPAVEELPPLSGGSSEADEEAPTITHEGSSSSNSEGEPLPASSAPEANSLGSESQEADHLAKDESTANPASEGTHEPEPSPPGAAEGQGEAAPAESGEARATPEGPATPEEISAEFARAKEATAKAPPPRPGQGQGQGQGGGRPPRPKGEQRPPKPKGPPPPPKPHPADEHLAQLAYVIVNEAGASVYSTSNVGREEFPDFDATLRGTVSIGRRLQDPLSELVKIEPQNIGVGLYQHDVNPKQLKESLEGVISSCVNFVGVDLNTASVPLLRHVSGLNQLTARRIVDRRQEKGAFADRSEIGEIEGIGPVTYTQAAGFLKLPGAPNPLDKTWVHPESYPVATRVLESFGFTPEILNDRERLPELHAKMNEADLPALARDLEVGEPTLHDIFEALARPERDPRDDLPKPIFKKGVLKLEDLSPGMELKGTVLNVVDFGAFIDIGLKDSGLVHISQLANRYIKSPHDVVSVGDVVTAWVLGVDNERKRVSLTMVKPGTERPRTERGGPGGGRPGRGEARGGERRGPGGPGGRPGRPGVSPCPSPQPMRPPGRQAPQGGRGRRARPGPGRIPPPVGPHPGPSGRSPRRRSPRRRWPVSRRPAPGRTRWRRPRPVRSESAPPPAGHASPAREARAPAASALEGRPHGERPAPELRPAQAALRGPASRSPERAAPPGGGPGGGSGPPARVAGTAPGRADERGAPDPRRLAGVIRRVRHADHPRSRRSATMVRMADPTTTPCPPAPSPSSSPTTSSPSSPTNPAAPRSSDTSPCPASIPSAGSTATARGCSCSPTTAGSPIG